MEIDKLFKDAGMSSLLVVHQQTAYSHRSSDIIMRTQICQNSPVARTSLTNTDSPAGCIIEGERNGSGVQGCEEGGSI